MKVTNWSEYAPFFKEEEFRCRCGCGDALMETEFMDRLYALRKEFGMPIKLSSGYRCSVHNQNVSSTGPFGPHTTGLAGDFLVSHNAAFRLTELAYQYGFTGIGWNQKGPQAGRFVHLDCMRPSTQSPRPSIWTY